MLRSCIVKVAILLAAGALITPEAIALTAAASSGTVNQQNTAQPAWPRNYELDGYEIQLYQPEALTWDGRRMTGRAAFVIGVPNQTPHYGFAYFSGATRTDMPGASVVLTDIRFGRVEIPIAPDQEGRVRTRLFEQFSGHGLSLPLPLVQASIAAAARPPAPQEAALPPRIVFADQLTILIPIAGAPIMRPVSGVTGFERVINTEAMLLRDIAATYHLQAGGSWFEASDLTGPWVPTIEVPADVIAAAKAADASQQADPLLPQDGKPISPPPAILLSTVPTELIQTDGPAKMGPVGGTSLMTIENADHAVFVDPSTRTTYVLISGRWFSAPGQSGPWTYVAGADLPAAFSRISPEDPKASVLISVPGTPQAREAAIAATIPAMAMIKTSATATASYDGAPQFAPIEGTSLRYAVNSAEPVIQVAPKQNYMVSQGVWFTAPAATGPWTVARTVPDAIYAIPPSSPVHYVTGVRVYGVAPKASQWAIRLSIWASASGRAAPSSMAPDILMPAIQVPVGCPGRRPTALVRASAWGQRVSVMASRPDGPGARVWRPIGALMQEQRLSGEAGASRMWGSAISMAAGELAPWWARAGAASALVRPPGPGEPGAE